MSKMYLYGQALRQTPLGSLQHSAKPSIVDSESPSLPKEPLLALSLRPRISALCASGVPSAKNMGSASNEHFCTSLKRLTTLRERGHTFCHYQWVATNNMNYIPCQMRATVEILSNSCRSSSALALYVLQRIHQIILL